MGNEEQTDPQGLYSLRIIVGEGSYHLQSVDLLGEFLRILFALLYFISNTMCIPVLFWGIWKSQEP